MTAIRRLTLLLAAACVWVAPATLVLSSCTVPRLVFVAPYDELTDAAVTDLQKDVLLHLRALELAKDPADEKYFIAYRGFYRDIDTLITRAASRPKNDTQSQQFAALREQVELLESIHRGQFEPEEIAPIRLAISRTFRAILTLELAKKP